jgi:hypothetical protein
MQRAPHGYYDTEAIGGALRLAGFAEASVETVDKVATAKTALEAATGYCQGNPLRGEIEARAAGSLQSVTEEVAAALAERFGNAQIEGKIRAHIITARKAA